MFGYLSMLVEDPTCAVDVIDVNFLIVGHTHASIDQYFSVLSNKIEHAKFVGTPAGMMWLLSHAHSKASGMRPLLPPRRIDVIYDVKAAFRDGDFLFTYHHYQTPHVFRFEKIAGSNKCSMVYKLFSSYKTWLPRPPTKLSSRAEPVNQRVTAVYVADIFSAIGGLDQLLRDCGVSTSSSQAVLASAAVLTEIGELDSTFSKLNESVMLPSFNKDTQYETGEDRQESIDAFKQLWSTTSLRERSDAEGGYIIWLKSPCSVSTNLEHLTVNHHLTPCCFPFVTISRSLCFYLARRFIRLKL